MTAHDLVVRGGSVVDGNGGPPVTADVAVDGDRIVEVGRVPGTGRREVDAAGAVVAPGFVDIHTHYDGQATVFSLPRRLRRLPTPGSRGCSRRRGTG